MPSRATLLCSRRSSSADERLGRLIEFLGVELESVHTPVHEATSALARGHLEEDSSCILASAETMAEVLGGGGDATAGCALLARSRFLFVHGFTARQPYSSVAAHLTGGAISSVQGFDSPDHQYRVGSSCREITQEFTGLSFGPIQKNTDFGFALSSTSGELSVLVDIDGIPLFVMLDKPRSTLFLLASEIADIGQRIDRAPATTEYFSRLAPPLMFLKYVFKERCWHSARRYANLIIDDPNLKRSYGFLSYRRLLEKTRDLNFAATIAFIPWNRNRTDRSTVQLFLNHPERLSLCIHGCDHTRSEFGVTDTAALNTQVITATGRMEALRNRTGLPYAAVMVFPQGKFSSQSLRVLEANNYLAAVNTDAIPTDLQDSHGLTIADFLSPAITKYGGVPLFLRRYPREVVDFAFDLFFAKPLLAVEHHEYFKHECRELIEFIHKLDSISPRLEWMALGKILSRSYLEKSAPQQTTCCRMSTDGLVIENTGALAKKYVILKDESNRVPVEKVLVNSETVPIAIEQGTLRLTVEVPAGASWTLSIVRRNDLPCVPISNQFVYASKVRVWRVLSEFRDNYLAKNDRLLSAAKRMKQTFERRAS